MSNRCIGVCDFECCWNNAWRKRCSLEPGHGGKCTCDPAELSFTLGPEPASSLPFKDRRQRCWPYRNRQF